MPYIDFVSKGDRISLWYTTNTRHGGTGDFDPARPVVVMLHPLFLDSTWLTTQFEDPRLNARFNLIAFDLRSAGKSNARPSGAHDTWVDAADLAFAYQALGLQPAHFFAVENISVNAALRLAALFPELCLSLTLINVPPPTELEWAFDMYGELLNMWCHPQDLDEFDHALLEMTNYFLGKTLWYRQDSTPELQDELVAFWSLTYPPWRRSRVYELMHCVLNRTPVSEKVLACITQPTLIIQSDKTDINPIKYAELLSRQLVNVEGKARVHTIKGSPEYVTLVPTCASIVNRVFAEFLSRQPHVPTTLRMVTPAERQERMQEALYRLAELMEDASIAERDPSSPLSFSCVTPEVLQSQSDVLSHQMLKEREAFSPLGMDGRPCRRFSERYNDHWFQAEKEEDVAQSHHLNKEEKLKALENLVTETEYLSSSSMDANGEYRSAQEPVTSEVARTGRLRRSTISKHVVEKATIGGASGGFAPTLIQNTLQMSRLRF